ncbi:MAG TPA: stage III sporulation protein AF [Syntrophomonas sp.]|jgi:stage III sporulation protein AF|nr:stage III sporulation protein AF [Syntrophomonas sp.]
MEVLVQIVRNLLVIIMVASFLELLLPDGGIKPFARLAMGLFILIAILNPALSLLYENREFKINLWDYEANQLQNEEILQAGKEINQRIITADSDAIKTRVEGQIGAMAMLVPGVEEVDIKAGVDSSGAITRLDLKVIPGNGSGTDDEKINVFSGQAGLSEEEQERMRQKIINLVQNMYGFQNVDIDIKFEGG